MQTEVEQALDKMESNGVINKVKSSTCAAPIRAVQKKNTDEIRTYGDSIATFNVCTDFVKYLIPKLKIYILHSEDVKCLMC